VSRKRRDKSLFVTGIQEFSILLATKNRLASPVICLSQVRRLQMEMIRSFVWLRFGGLCNNVDLVEKSRFLPKFQRRGYDYLFEDFALTADEPRIYWRHSTPRTSRDAGILLSAFGEV